MSSATTERRSNSSTSSTAVGSPLRPERGSSVSFSSSPQGGARGMSSHAAAAEAAASPRSPSTRGSSSAAADSSEVRLRNSNSLLNSAAAAGSSSLSRRMLLGRLRSSSAPGTSGTFSFPQLPQRHRNRARSGNGNYGEAEAGEKQAAASCDHEDLLSSSDAEKVAASLQAHMDKEDSMIYLDGPQIYTCAQCRTHLTSHDDIISKSFHGRHGRAYLFDQCVNVTSGPAEDRLLITGMHSVCDIFCNRCKSMVGWTYAKAYEPSQKYKEGKYIIEKINLHLEETMYGIDHPAGERGDKWRVRSMSWGRGGDGRHHRYYNDYRSSSDDHHMEDCEREIVYEYAAVRRDRSVSLGSHVAANLPPTPPPGSRPKRSVTLSGPVVPTLSTSLGSPHASAASRSDM